MPGIYDLMRGIQQQGEEGRQRGLASLVGKAYAQPDQRQQILGTVAQRGAPDMAMQAQQGFSKMDETSAADLAREAGMFVALAQSGDEQTIQAAYQQLARKAQQAGHPVPLQYNPSFLPGIEKLASAGGAVGGNVQSTYIDAQGNRVAIMRDGSTQVLGQNAPSNQIIDTGNGFFGVNKGNLQAAPVMMGGQAPQQPQPQRAPGEVPFSIDPSLPPEVQASIRQNESAFAAVPDGGSVQIGQQGQQLRSAPKQPSPIEQARFGLDAERLRLAQESAGVPAGYRRTAEGALEAIPGGPADPSAPKPMSAADRAKLDQRMRKEKMLLSANNAGIDQTVKLIDSILARKGDLGGVTGIGRVGSMIPGTDWADVAAKLDTLKGRSAFGALQQMRANSPTGGALGQVSERELYLLQNAETQLQNSQSPEALAQALADYKAALLESKKRMAEGVDEFYSQQGAQSAAPQAGNLSGMSDADILRALGQ